MILRPLGDRVLIAPIATRAESAAGLALVEHWKPEQMGTVVAVGSAVHPRKADAEEMAAKLDEMLSVTPEDAVTLTDARDLLMALVAREPVCQPGDLVLFSWQAGQELLDHDTDTRYLLLKEDDLIAVIEKDAVPV